MLASTTLPLNQEDLLRLRRMPIDSTDATASFVPFAWTSVYPWSRRRAVRSTFHQGDSSAASYINVCGRRNPNLDECIVQNVNSLKGKICTGMPEIGVQPTEPLYIDKLNIVDAPNAKISLSDVYLSGLCDFKINAFHMNLEKQHFDVDIAFNRIQMNMTYNFNVNIIAPVALKGPIHITTGT